MDDTDRQRLQQTFTRFDRDHSGSVDLSELADVMQSLGVSVSNSQLEDLIRQANVNDRGELDCEAFIQLVHIWREAAKMRLFEGTNSPSDVRNKMRKALGTRLLLSDSWGRCLFDGLVVAVTLAAYVVVLLADAVQQGLEGPLQVVQIITTATFVCDAAVSALTYDAECEDTYSSGMNHYARTWLLPDVIAAVPWGLIVRGLPGVFLRHVPLLKLCKIPSFWRCSGRMPMSATYITFHYKVLPITLLAVLFCVMVHGFTIGFMLVKQRENLDPLIDGAGTYPYTAAVYFVIYTLGTVGFGNIEIASVNEKLFCCLVLCGSILANGFIVGKLVAIMQAADLEKDRTGKLRQTLAVLDHFDLPHALQDEVLQFQDHLLGHALGASYSATLNGLPSELHANISIVVKVKLLSSADFLDQLHAVVKVALAQALGNVVLVPEQYVVGMDEEVRCMYFIAHGFVDVLGRNGTRLRTLASNHYFGCGALIGNVRSSVAIKSLGYCDLWSLSRLDVLHISRQFRGLRTALAAVVNMHEQFDCVPDTAHDTIQSSPRQAPVGLSDGAFEQCSDGGGELEDASQFQSLSRKTDRLRALTQRLANARRALDEACQGQLRSDASV